MPKPKLVLTHADLKAENTEENPNNVVPASNGNATVEDGMLRSWNEEDGPYETVVCNAVSKIRKKLNRPDLIERVWKYGYKFNG